MPHYASRLARNPTFLFWARALTEVKTMNAIVVLFYLHRGVSLSQVFYLSLVFAATTLVLEVPTGYLADRLGRKRTLLLGVVILIASQALTFTASGFWPFVVVLMLMAATDACFSGTEEAMLYDTLVQTGRETEMTKWNGRIHGARHMLKIFMPMVGAVIAAHLTQPEFWTVIGIDMVAAVGALIMLARTVEPKHTREVAKEETGIFKQSLQTIRANPFLFRAATNKVVLFVVSLVVWRAYMPVLVQYGATPMYLGGLYLIFHLFVFISHWYIGAIEARVGAARILIGTNVSMMIMLGVLFFSRNIWMLAAATIFVFVSEGLREPVFAHSMNRVIASKSRATTLSNLFVLKSAIDIPIMFIAGRVAAIDARYPFLVCLALAGATLIFFSVRSNDLAHITLAGEDSLEVV